VCSLNPGGAGNITDVHKSDQNVSTRSSKRNLIQVFKSKNIKTFESTKKQVVVFFLYDNQAYYTLLAISEFTHYGITEAQV